MLLRRLALGTLLLCSLSRSAAGQAVTAEEHYQRGIAAFEAGDYVVACGELRESYRLDPLPGALFTLATCEMRAGRLASAVARFSEYAALVDRLPPDQQAREAKRRAVAESELRVLHARVPHVRLRLSDPTHTAQVTLNGTVIARESLGVELPVDPGEQTVEQRFVNGHVSRVRVTLREGQSKVVELDSAAAGAGADATPTVHARPADSTVRPEPTRSALPFVIGGIGAAGIVVGGVAGSFAINHAATVRRECDGPACRNLEGKEAADAGQRAALVSTVAFGVGIAGLATGIILFVASSPSSSRSSGRLELNVSPQSVALSGAF